MPSKSSVVWHRITEPLNVNIPDMLLRDAMGEPVVLIQDNPAIVHACLRQIRKLLRRCECGAPFVCDGHPRKRCVECAAKKKGENSKQRNRRYRERRSREAAVRT